VKGRKAQLILQSRKHLIIFDEKVVVVWRRGSKELLIKAEGEPKFPIFADQIYNIEERVAEELLKSIFGDSRCS